jgi:ubiquinone/menaquinone biosynthesis C-methylase UbiE
MITNKTILKKLLLAILMLFLSLVPYLSGRHDRARDTWQQPQKVMDVIGIKPGMTIGEIGAGEGYFTFKLAGKVGPTGKIYANDILDRCLRTIREKSTKQGLTNIITVKGKVADPLFPETQLDMAFMCYVIHDMEKPVEFLHNLQRYLKPGAPLVILERDPIKVPSAAGHFFSREKLLRVIKEGGFTVVRTETFLEKDNIYICENDK